MTLSNTWERIIDLPKSTKHNGENHVVLVRTNKATNRITNAHSYANFFFWSGFICQLYYDKKRKKYQHCIYIYGVGLCHLWVWARLGCSWGCASVVLTLVLISCASFQSGSTTWAFVSCTCCRNFKFLRFQRLHGIVARYKLKVCSITFHKLVSSHN